MVWLSLWFLVVLKLPILYLAYVIWWAVKEPPRAGADPTGAGDSPGGGPDRRRPPGPRRGARGGPHGSPVRRAARARRVRAARAS